MDDIGKKPMITQMSEKQTEKVMSGLRQSLWRLALNGIIQKLA